MISPLTSIIIEPLPRPASLNRFVHGYHLVEVIGHGPSSTVYRGIRANRQFAVKEILASSMSKDKYFRMVATLEKMDDLHDIYVAKVLDWHQDANALFLMSELIPGQSVECYHENPLGWELAVEIAIAVGSSLASIWYELETIHGNLKPSNVFVKISGGILTGLTITDFGISANVATKSIDLLSVTESYMAPEMLTGEAMDQTCDFFSLGALMIFLATGKPPPDEIVDDQATLIANAPKHLLHAIRSLLQRRASDRPNGWKEVIQLLRQSRNRDPFSEEEKTYVPVQKDSAPGYLSEFSIGTTDSSFERIPPLTAAPLLHRQMPESIETSHPKNAPRLADGEIIAKNYRVVRLLRQDINFGLYEIVDVTYKRLLLLKIISRHGMQFPAVRERLRVESTLMSSLDRRHFTAVVGRSSWNGQDYFLTECPLGHPMTDYLKNGATLAEGQALWVAHELAAAFQRGNKACQLIHRNVNPEHMVILTDTDRRLMITDCSLAHGLVPLDFEDFSIREKMPTIGVTTMLTVGTPSYMSPEQIRGEMPNISMDIYGIGCLLFRMLAGRTPFVASNAKSMLQSHLYEHPPLLNQFVQVTPATNSLVKDCLAKDPNQRPKDYDELIRILGRCAFAVDLNKKRKVSGFTTRQFSTTTRRQYRAG